MKYTVKELTEEVQEIISAGYAITDFAQKELSLTQSISTNLPLFRNRCAFSGG